MKIATEAAEQWPFSRSDIAELINVPVRQLNNWIDRNDLWQTSRTNHGRGYYRLGDVFDLAGFAALRIAGVPERRAAQYVRNFGFFRSFLGSSDQLASFSYRNGEWDIGVFDASAIVSLTINMRTIGEDIFRRLGPMLAPSGDNGPSEAFLQFQNYCFCLIREERLSPGAVPQFEAVSR